MRQGGQGVGQGGVKQGGAKEYGQFDPDRVRLGPGDGQGSGTAHVGVNAAGP